jgi:hypothetical protein
LRAYGPQAKAVGISLQPTYGFDLGAGIEGAVGSDYKVDASFFSKHIKRAIYLQVRAQGPRAFTPSLLQQTRRGFDC